MDTHKKRGNGTKRYKRKETKRYKKKGTKSKRYKRGMRGG